MDDIKIRLTWGCDCNNHERLETAVRIPVNTPYHFVEQVFRAAWEDFLREKATHATPQKS